MKKLYAILLCFFSSVCLYAEIEIEGGVGLSYNNNQLKNTDITISSKSFDTNFNGQLKYFFSELSKFGFGGTIGFAFPIKNSYSFTYSADDKYHIIQDDTWWIQQNHTPTIYGYDSSELKFFIEPDFFYRFMINDLTRINIGIGPNYSIRYKKFLYADEKDFVTKKSGGIEYKGYSKITLEKILRQNFGVCAHIQCAMDKPFIKEFGVEGKFDFLELSKFTQQEIQPCSNYSISVFVRLGSSLPNLKERKEIIRQQEIERNNQIALEQERIFQENEKLKTHYKIFNNWYEKDKFPSYIKNVQELTIGDPNFINNNPYGFEKDLAYFPSNNGSVLQWLPDGCLYDFAGAASSQLHWSCLTYILVSENQRSKMFNNYYEKFYHYVGPYTYTTTNGSLNTVPSFEIIFYGE